MGGHTERRRVEVEPGTDEITLVVTCWSGREQRLANQRRQWFLCIHRPYPDADFVFQVTKVVGRCVGEGIGPRILGDLQGPVGPYVECGHAVVLPGKF